MCLCVRESVLSQAVQIARRDVRGAAACLKSDGRRGRGTARTHIRIRIYCTIVYCTVLSVLYCTVLSSCDSLFYGARAQYF